MFQAQHKKPRGFNKKPSTRSETENKITLGSRHETKMKEFESASAQALAKEKQIASIEKQIQSILATKKSRGRLNGVEQDLLFNLRQEQDVLQQEVQVLRSRSLENSYLLKTAPVIAAYQDDTFNVAAPAMRRAVSAPTPQGGQKVGLTAWMKAKDAPTGRVDRRELLEAWCLQTDKTFIPKNPYSHEEIDKCPDPDCGAVGEVANTANGRMNCKQCGTEIDITFISRHTSFKEIKTTEMMPEFPYKRINHFQEWLSAIQAKQCTEIVEKVLSGLEKEFKKQGITDYATLTPKYVKSCLRKLGHTKYYEHAEYIIHNFNKLPPPILTVETEMTFRQMFQDIQVPFELCKPPKRKNFLSYSYVFHKFAMLEGEDHLIEHFPLLKSRQKLKKQDDIWKEMCKILKWEFIPSV